MNLWRLPERDSGEGLQRESEGREEVKENERKYASEGEKGGKWLNVHKRKKWKPEDEG